MSWRGWAQRFGRKCTDLESVCAGGQDLLVDSDGGTAQRRATSGRRRISESPWRSRAPGRAQVGRPAGDTPGPAGRRESGAAARADSGLHVLRAGVSASSGRGRKRKSALRRPPQQQRRPGPSPATRRSGSASEAAPRDPEPAPPSTARRAAGRPARRWGRSARRSAPRPPCSGASCSGW